MNKLFIIIALAAIQSGCAAPPTHVGTTQDVLLSFTDLATEIRVSRKAATVVPVSSRNSAEETGDSS